MSAPGPPHFYHNTSLDLDTILEALPMNFESIQMTSKEHHLPPCKKQKPTITVSSTKFLSLPNVARSTQAYQRMQNGTLKTWVYNIHLVPT
jgi:hypothetical protein